MKNFQMFSMLRYDDETAKTALKEKRYRDFDSRQREIDESLGFRRMASFADWGCCHWTRGTGYQYAMGANLAQIPAALHLDRWNPPIISQPQLLSIDIEEWTPNEDDPLDKMLWSIKQLQLLADEVHRQTDHGMRVGFYGILPWQGYNQSKYEYWLRGYEGLTLSNDYAEQCLHRIDKWVTYTMILAENLYPHIDALFPSLYAPWYEDEHEERDGNRWLNYCRYITDWCSTEPKPFYPYMWPSAKNPYGKPLANELWQQGVDIVRRSGASGVVLWNEPNKPIKVDDERLRI